MFKARGKSGPGQPAWRLPAARLEPEFSFLISSPKRVWLRRAVASSLGAGGLPKVSSRSNCASGNTGCVVHAMSACSGFWDQGETGGMMSLPSRLIRMLTSDWLSLLAAFSSSPASFVAGELSSGFSAEGRSSGAGSGIFRVHQDRMLHATTRRPVHIVPDHPATVYCQLWKDKMPVSLIRRLTRERNIPIQKPCPAKL